MNEKYYFSGCKSNAVANECACDGEHSFVVSGGLAQMKILPSINILFAFFSCSALLGLIKQGNIPFLIAS